MLAYKKSLYYGIMVLFLVLEMASQYHPQLNLEANQQPSTQRPHFAGLASSCCISCAGDRVGENQSLSWKWGCNSQGPRFQGTWVITPSETHLEPKFRPGFGLEFRPRLLVGQNRLKNRPVKKGL